MNAEQAIAELDAMEASSDEEVSHGRADEILVQFLRDNGQGDVADAFEEARERVGFWYA